MPRPKKGPRLGGSPAHQRLIMSNLASQLFEHGAITTTEAKARVLRPVAEKLITKAKKGDLHNRREVLKTIRSKDVVHTLFVDIAPTFSERPGGYTRITKIGPRKGDNAPMAKIELVREAYQPKVKPVPARLAEINRGFSQRKESAGQSIASSDEGGQTHGEPASNIRKTSVDLERSPSAEDLIVAEHSSDYHSGDARGFFQELQEDQYVNGQHQSNGALSLEWSCADDWGQFVGFARRAMPEMFESAAVARWWRLDDSGYPLMASEAEDDEVPVSRFEPIHRILAEDDERPMSFCCIRNEGLSLTWQRPFHKTPWSRLPRAQAAFVAAPGSRDGMARDTLLRLMTLTGTRHVQTLAAHRPDLLSSPLTVVSS